MIQSVLLVEDIPEVRMWMGRLLRGAFPGVVITECPRVDEGLLAMERRTFDLALVDLGLPDGSGVDVVLALRERQPDTRSVVVTIHDDDDHLFPALQAGAFGYLLKDQPQELLEEQLRRIIQGEPPLSPPIARRVISYFARQSAVQADKVDLTERESDVLLRVAKGYTLPEIGNQLNLSRHTIADYVKQIYRKLNVSSRAEAALEARRLGIVRG